MRSCRCDSLDSWSTRATTRSIRPTWLTATALPTRTSRNARTPTTASWSPRTETVRDSHLLTGSPRRLLVVATGNITNNALLGLFESYVEAIVAAFDECDYVELGPRALVVHRRRDDEQGR